MTRTKLLLLAGVAGIAIVGSVAALAQNPGQVIVTTPTGNELVALQTLGPQSAAITTNNLAAWITGGGGGGAGSFTTLTASSTVTLSPASHNVAISPTGTGTVTISPAGALTMNPTTASALDNTVIGGTTPLAGTFTTLSATNTVTLSPASHNVAISPTGTGTVTISPVGALTVNPTAASTIDNTAVGVTTSAAGKFTTLQNTTSAGLTVAVSTDATHTDATLCEDTTTHVVYFGSGAAGICLGTSSLRFKHDVEPLTAGLNQIMGLDPISYKLNADHGDPDHTLYGFSAEQGGRVLPELMGTDPQGAPNTFDYLGVVPVLVKAIQEQQAQIEELKHQLHTRAASAQ